MGYYQCICIKEKFIFKAYTSRLDIWSKVLSLQFSLIHIHSYTWYTVYGSYSYAGKNTDEVLNVFIILIIKTVSFTSTMRPTSVCIHLPYVLSRCMVKQSAYNNTTLRSLFWQGVTFTVSVEYHIVSHLYSMIILWDSHVHRLSKWPLCLSLTLLCHFIRRSRPLLQ